MQTNLLTSVGNLGQSVSCTNSNRNMKNLSSDSLVKKKRSSLKHPIIVESLDELNDPKEGLQFLVNKSTKYLVLGTFPAKESIYADFYYQNQIISFFGEALAAVGNLKNLTNEQRKEFLLKVTIGLGDIFRYIERAKDGKGKETNKDSGIKKAIYNDIDLILKGHPNIEYLIFNGKKPYEWLRKDRPSVFERNNIEFLVLPSTSDANRGSAEGRFNHGKKWTDFFMSKGI